MNAEVHESTAVPQAAHERPGNWAPAAGMPLLPPALLVAALAVGAFSQGGARPWPAAWMAVLLGGSALVSWLTGRRPVRPRPAARPARMGPPARLGLALAALLAGWALARGALAGHPSSGLGYAALLAGVLAVVAVVTRLPRDEIGWLVRSVLAVGVGVAATGWLGVVLRLPPWGHPDAGLWRAASAITYENATAGLLVPLALLALGMTAQTQSRSEARAYALIATALLAGAGATLSRGGALALVVGLGVLVVVLRRSAVRLVPPVVGATIAVVGLVPSLPADLPPRPWLALTGLAGGLAVAATRPRLAAGVGLAGVLLVGVVAAVVGAGRWLPLAAGRLSPWSTERAEQLRTALHLWSGDPVLGVGPGSPPLVWERSDGTTLIARYVHNEYVQVLLELGVVGATLLALLGVVALRLIREARAPGARRPAAAVGALAGTSAFLVHSATDFLWHVPVIPICVAAILAVAMRREERL